VLQKAGLKPGNISYFITPQQELNNKVAGQGPIGGTKLPSPQPVNLTVYRLELVTVPNVVGMDYQQAVNTFVAAGIGGQRREKETSDPKMNEKVFAQGIAAGMKVSKGTVIELIVYKLVAASLAMSNVVGQNLDDAGKFFSSRGYIVKVDQVKTTNQEQGNKIFAQDPAPGTPLKPAQTILLKVYKYESGVTVPNVVGLHLINALDLLNKSSLRYELVGAQEPKTPQQQGTIFSQDPAAGVQVAKSAVVKLVMYKDSLPVPNVVGMKLADAIKAIETAGYKPPVYNPDFLKVPPPIYLKVVSQNPGAGQKLAYGSWISIDAKAMALMPNVIGMDYERAKAAIKGMNVLVGAYELRQVSTSDPNQRNKVFSQDPPAGAEVVVGPGPIYRFPGNPKLGVYK
jgi:beta-lactam-binding protein with PASTA domain